MAYKGKIDISSLKNPHKVKGDINKIIFRSLWERQLCYWCDENPKVLSWGIEIVIVKYFNPIKKRPAKYYIDFYIQFDDARELLVEVKPHAQSIPPVLTESKMTKTGRPTKRFQREQETWDINQEKWRIARKFAKENGMEFFVFTEHTLDDLGIRRVSPKDDKVLRKNLMLENKKWRKKPAKPKRPRSSYKRNK